MVSTQVPCLSKSRSTGTVQAVARLVRGLALLVPGVLGDVVGMARVRGGRKVRSAVKMGREGCMVLGRGLWLEVG